jgi:hypothetical protein
MRRLSVLLLVVVVVLLGFTALEAPPAARAQEATPTADEMGEGLSFTLLGLLPGVSLPARPICRWPARSLRQGRASPLMPVIRLAPWSSSSPGP